ncbi:MAG: hypothetical protein ABEJ61_05740 [Haloferacaceae archaeon]
MNPVRVVRTVLWWLVMFVGLIGSSVSGYMVIKGPFLGRGVLEPTPLMIYSGAFLIGMIVFAVGGSKLVNLYFG